MTEEKKNQKEKNPIAEALNWEQRVKSEMESPHKWNESWGNYFVRGGEPLEYSDKIRFLDEKLRSLPESAKNPPKYGTGPGFKELCPDYRRKKMFGQPEA